MGKIIGIDLGTTNSCVSVFEGCNAVVVANSEGNRITPSIVAFMPDGEAKVGEPAKRQAITNPTKTIYSIKRLMGETYNHICKDMGQMPYQIYCGNNNVPYFNIDGRNFTPQEISAMILQKMKSTAEDYLGQEVSEAVISVPAYFNDNQRQATKEAGLIAGLDVKCIINEPIAAALSYGYDNFTRDMKIAVFDLGGGTFDISVVDFSRGVLEVLSTNGDTHLGGDDFDQVIIDWLLSEFQKEEGIDLKKDPVAYQRLKEAAEKAKKELSSVSSTEINLPYITTVGGVLKHLNKIITRNKFESLAHHLIQALKEPCLKAMQDACINKYELDKVLLVGGSSRIPAVQNLVRDVFGVVPSKSVNPDEAVAIGASIKGAMINGDKSVDNIELRDVTSFSFGIETKGGAMYKLIEANTTIPCQKTEVFSTAEDNQTEVAIHVLQGDQPLASQNMSIGQFNLTGICPAPCGVPQIEVTFKIDGNGLLMVSAKDQATGKQQAVRIEGKTGLSKEDIERMKAVAAANAEAAKRERERSEYQIDSSYIGGAIYKNDEQRHKNDHSFPKHGNEKIFISYKRVDKEIAYKIQSMIEDGAGEKCWIDIDGIESDAQFTNVIIEAIKRSEVFLFIYSKSHQNIVDFENDWTIRELNYANSRKKRIVFINIDGTELIDYIMFMFPNKQQVDATSNIALKKLVTDICGWLK